MEDLSKMLQNIKVRPKLYLGKISLERLSAFINGYICRQFEEDSTNSTGFYPEFQVFIQDKYGIQTDHGWSEIIAFFSSDDVEAFNNFYSDLNEFLEKHKEYS